MQRSNGYLTYFELSDGLNGVVPATRGTVEQLRRAVQATREEPAGWGLEWPELTAAVLQCAGPGPGPYVKKPNYKRDGSFEYYMSEPIRDNDAKGVGPFIWASLEMEQQGLIK